MVDFDKPVVIFISKDGCVACSEFKRHWNQFVKERGSEVTIRTISLKNGKRTPGPLQRYTRFVPCVIMMNPRSYYKMFNKDDMLNLTYMRQEMITGVPASFLLDVSVFNADEVSVRKPDGSLTLEYRFSGAANTHKNLIKWFNNNKDSVMNARHNKEIPQDYMEEYSDNMIVFGDATESTEKD